MRVYAIVDPLTGKDIEICIECVAAWAANGLLVPDIRNAEEKEGTCSNTEGHDDEQEEGSAGSVLGGGLGEGG